MKPTHDDPPWLRGARPPSSPQRSVYLPLPLLQRVADLRNRNVDINVSLVCRVALEDAVTQAETLPPVP